MSQTATETGATCRVEDGVCSRHTANNPTCTMYAGPDRSDANLRRVLLETLIAEYGGTEEDWTALGSLTRVVKAIRGCTSAAPVR